MFAKLFSSLVAVLLISTLAIPNLAFGSLADDQAKNNQVATQVRAAFGGVPEVTVTAINANQAGAPAPGTSVDVNGYVLKTDVAIAAASAMKYGIAEGLKPNAKDEPGFHINASLAEHVKGNLGVISGSLTEFVSGPPFVARREKERKRELDASLSIEPSTPEEPQPTDNPSGEGGTKVPEVVEVPTSNETMNRLLSPDSLITTPSPLTKPDLDSALPTLLNPAPISQQGDNLSYTSPAGVPAKEVTVTTYAYNAQTNNFTSAAGETLNMNYLDAIVNFTQMSNPYGTLKNNQVNYDASNNSWVFTDNITGASSAIPNTFSSLTSMQSARTILNQQIPAINYTEAELDLAVRMAMAEASSIQDKYGLTKEAALQQALEVARNRVLASNYPNSLDGVIKQNKQFEVVSNGSINRQPRDSALYKKTEALAKAVFDGQAPAVAVNSEGQGHLNFGNQQVIASRSSSGGGVTASQDTKAGFSNLGSYGDTLFVPDTRRPNTTQHTSGFMHGRTTGAPDFTAGYNVTKPDFTAAVNMGSNLNLPSNGTGGTSAAPVVSVEVLPNTGGGIKVSLGLPINIGGVSGLTGEGASTGQAIGSQIGALFGTTACGNTCATIGASLGSVFGELINRGLSNSDNTNTPSGGTGDSADLDEQYSCKLYPLLECPQPATTTPPITSSNNASSTTHSGAWAALQEAVDAFLWNRGQTTMTNTQATETTEPRVPVLLVINDQTKEIELLRPDIIHALASDQLNPTERDDMRQLLDETALLFADDGSVVYSNGLYSPPVESGQSADAAAPRYVYLIERIDENGNQIQVSSESPVDNTLLQRVLQRVLTDSSSFNLADVKDVSYRLIDPDSSIPADEYYDYVISLQNGDERNVSVPQYSSIQTMRDRFGSIGFQGQVLDLLTLAREDNSEPPQTVIQKLWDWSTKIFNQDTTTTPDTYTAIDASLLSTQWSAEDVEGVFMYPNAAVSCYEDIEGYDKGFVYSALIRDENDLYVVTEGLCGDYATSTLPIAVSLRLAGQFGINDIDYETVANVGYIVSDPVEETALRPGITKLYLPPTATRIPSDVPTTSPTEEQLEPAPEPNQLPNLTNSVTFEVKVVTNNGQIVTDWSQSESLTISQNMQLYFRWIADDYQQCLPFLNDQGVYALTVANRTMTTGNTESEAFNVVENTGTYRIECGGQRNNEYGVDVREINVLLQ